MEIKKIAYEKYCLNWMMNHNCTLPMLMDALQEIINELDEEERVNLKEVFKTWDHDLGFSGELWVGFDEFLDCEYKDKHFMKSLLSKEEYELYLLEGLAK